MRLRFISFSTPLILMTAFSLNHASAMSKPRPIPRDMIDGVAAEKITDERAEIDAIAVDEVKKKGLVGVGLAIYEDGKVIYKRGYGFANRESDIPARSSITMFRWASTSKPVTAVTAMVAQQAGKINVDKDVRNYWTSYKIPCTYGIEGSDLKPVPDCNTPASSKDVLTTKMLLNHTAGIPHYTNGVGSPNPSVAQTNNPEINTGIEWATSKVRAMPLVSIPGAESNYSTFGFNLAGVVLEKAVKKTFFEQVKTGVLNPLGITTMQPDYYWASIANRARGYNGDGTRDTFNDVSWKLPGGGFISTVEDMAKFCGGITGDVVLSSGSKTLLWTKTKLTNGSTTGYGMGFSIGTHYGQKAVAHNGSQEGTGTYFAALPDKKICVAVMANNEGADMRDLSLRVERGLIEGIWE